MFAQEVIRILQVAGVKFFLGDGITERSGTVNVDFQRLIKLDSLISSPPKSLDSNMELIGWIDQSVGGFFRNLF
jgi:hypothetical protein